MSENEAKGKIMEAVQALLSEGCPVEDITVRKIAQRAGVGIGTVSYHFHSKDKLVYEVIAGQMAALAGGLNSGEGAGTPRERLRRFFSKTADMALEHSKLFRAQLAYDIVNGDMSICYYITPLLKEHFGSSKSDLEIKLIALELIAAMQMILLKTEEFQRYAGVSVRNESQREEVIDALMGTVIQEKN